MARQPRPNSRKLTFKVSTGQRTDFDATLYAYVFNSGGKLVEKSEIKNGKLEVNAPSGRSKLPRILIAPNIQDETGEEAKPSAERLLSLGAYEPVLRRGRDLIDTIRIPGPIIDLWPLCFCWVRGKVIRASDNLPVCNARVHICEVDRIPFWIERLPDREIFRLRDDLLEELRRPRIPRPPFPDPIPFRFRPDIDPPRPLPDRDVRPDPIITRRLLDRRPQLPQSRLDVGIRTRDFTRLRDIDRRISFEPPIVSREPLELPDDLQIGLQTNSVVSLRRTLSQRWKLIAPFLCLWPRWWWRFRCDEIAVVDTDEFGNFERTILYPCNGDKPDLYFWVEYDFGTGHETVYHPPIPCNTYWNYACGTEITIRVTDPRVPGCGGNPDLPGKEVRVVSIGNGVSIPEIASSGLTTAGEPFAKTLEPRVHFSRSELIGSGFPYFRWSVRRLSGPNGADYRTPGSWTPLTREVFRRYTDGATEPSYLLGPLSLTGPDAAPAPNLFRLQPEDPPSGAGEEWVVRNQHVELATGYFETDDLPGTPVHTTGVGWSDDSAAGRYELKLELFDSSGNRVEDWASKGIALTIIDEPAPFGPGTLTAVPAPADNQLIESGDLNGFRMVLRVDNNRCSAEIHPVGGDLAPDPDCGFHEYASGDNAGLSFTARHPNNFAEYDFDTGRGTGGPIPIASTTGMSGLPGNDGFTTGGGFSYSKNVAVSSLLGACSNAAFYERLHVQALATNGYSTIDAYNASDNAAFALAEPCPDNSGNAGGGND